MADNGNGNGNGNSRRRHGLFAALGTIPPAVWGVIITQFVGLMIWAVRLDRQVQDNAKQIAELSQQDTYPGRLLKQRVDYNDERLRYIVNYILFMREEIARIAPPQPGGPHPPPVLPPTPGVTPLDPVPRTPEPPK